MGERRASPGSRRPTAPPPLPKVIDTEALAAVHAATRALISATDPDAVVWLLHQLVADLGGAVVPAEVAPPHAVPVDLSLGQGRPVLAVGPPVSVAQMNLESLLPAVAEDARTAVLRLRNDVRLQGDAGTDALTGLLTRRTLLRRLAHLREGDSVALIELDLVKRGHAVGDEALRAFGALLRGAVRAGDVVGRYGGEEVLVGFRGVGLQEATLRVEQFRRTWKSQSTTVTFSAGVAAVGQAGAQAALTAADAARNRAKESGRDRTEQAHVQS